MTAPAILTAEIARQLLRYEPETGLLFWLPRPLLMFPCSRSGKIWNTRYAGKEAFSAVDKQGYKLGAIFGVMYKAHRIAWLLHHGTWPNADIDHLNGNRADNRAENLRDVRRALNARNRKLGKDNRSGAAGVQQRGENRWFASLVFEGRFITLGTFNSFEEAAAARARANLQLGFSSRHGKP